MNSWRLTILAALVCAGGLRAQIVLVVDSLAIGSQGTITLNGAGNFGGAQRFTTDSGLFTGTQLYDLRVTVRMFDFGAALTWTPSVRIVSDNGGSPVGGSVIATLVLPSGASTYTFPQNSDTIDVTFVQGPGSLILAASTVYWITITGGVTGGGGVAGLNVSTAGTGASGAWLTPSDQVYASGPGLATISPGLLNILVAIPESSAWALQAGAVGFVVMAIRRFRRTVVA